MTTIPTMVAVQSSNIESIGYHVNELHVRFKTGAHYVYEGTNDELHRAFLASDSKGKFLGSHLKGKFVTRKLMAAE